MKQNHNIWRVTAVAAALCLLLSSNLPMLARAEDLGGPDPDDTTVTQPEAPESSAPSQPESSVPSEPDASAPQEPGSSEPENPDTSVPEETEPTEPEGTDPTEPTEPTDPTDPVDPPEPPQPDDPEELPDVDTVPPTLQHAHIPAANNGDVVTFLAVAQDDLSLQYVRLYYRTSGSAVWEQTDMTAGENFTYSASLEVTLSGLEYFIEISDGTNILTEGSAEYPISIAVTNHILISGITPGRVDTTAVSAGIAAVVTGSNFSEDMVVTVGGAAVEFTFVSSKEIHFNIPMNEMGKADMVITRGLESAVLPNAVVYSDPTSYVKVSSKTELYANEQVRIPVTVGATDSITAVDLQILLDPTWFADVNFEMSQTNPDALSHFSVSGDGIVKISIASAMPLVTGEPIGYLTATVKTVTEITTAPISITSALFNSISVDTRINCNLKILPSFNIGGKVHYYNSQEGLAGVKVTLSTGQITYTDDQGYYSFSNVHANQVTVTLEFKGGDNGAVTSLDAALVLQAATEATNILTEHQLLAADVNRDGLINAQDASAILQKDVGLIEGPFSSSGNDWIFAGTELELTGNTTGADISGILLGDVSGNWTATPVEELE